MHRCSSTVMAFVVFILLSVSCSQSARSQQVQMPDGSAMPKRIYSENGIRPTQRWCIMGNAALKALPDDNAPTVGQLEFLEAVLLADEYPEKSSEAAVKPYTLTGAARTANQDWALVCNPSADTSGSISVGSLRGWIPRRYLTDRMEAETDERTAIHRKVVAVNPQELANEPLQEVPALPAVPGTIAGTPDPAPRLRIRLYQNLYAYAEYGDYYLAATLPEIEDTNPMNLRLNVLGWVPKARMAVWSTRECLEWDRSTWPQRFEIAGQPERGPGRMFPSATHAINAYSLLESNQSLGLIPSTTEPQPARSERGEILRTPKDAMRFHLLTDHEDAIRTKLPNADQWIHKQRGIADNWLYEIGGLISLRNDGGNYAESIEAQQRRLEELRSEVANLDVLFVIDDSLSNSVGLRAVATLVPEMVKTLLKETNEQRTVRVTLVFYANGTDASGQKAVRVSRIRAYPLTSANQGQIVAELENHQPFVATNSQPLEELFGGLEQGILAAEFERWSRKILFVLGDCGDITGMNDLRQDQNVKADARGITTAARTRIRKITESLAAKKSGPVEVHVVQLQDPELNDAETFPYLKMFHGQLNNELRQQFQSRVASRLVEYNKDRQPILDTVFTYTVFPTPVLQLNANALKQLEQQVKQLVNDLLLPRIKAAADQGQDLRALLRIAETTGFEDAATAAAGAGYDISEATKADFQAMGKDERFAEMYEKRRLNPYARMYVWQNSPQKPATGGRLLPQMRRKLLVSDTELNRAIVVLTSIEKTLLEGRAVDLVQPAKSVMQAATGGLARFAVGKSEEEKAKILYRALCFKSPFFGPILEGKAGEGPVLPGNEDYKELLLKLRLLECIRDNAPANRADFEFSDGRWTRRTPPNGADDRGFTSYIEGGAAKGDIEGGAGGAARRERYYYIDVVDEWP